MQILLLRNFDVAVFVHIGRQANQADRVSGLLYPGSAERIRDVIPSETILLAKGGIVSCTQAKRLARCGVDGVVLGRALMQVCA